MLEIAEIRKEFAVCLKQMALTLETLDAKTPTDIDIKVAEFLVLLVKDLDQQQVLLAIIKQFKQSQNKEREKPRHLSVVK